MIVETVVTTVSPTGEVHVAPMGVREADGLLLLAPFRPSRTLDNLLATHSAVVNLVDDVRVFAGCVTGRREWPVVPVGDDHVGGAEGDGATRRSNARRLACALVHRRVAVARVEEDPQRPRLWCREVGRGVHAPFAGFNRAQGAVVEGAVLVSRLHMLAAEKIDREVDYLRIAIDKTAGPREREAWGWLMQAIAEHRRAQGD